MKYVDCYAGAVPTANKVDFIEQTRTVATIFKEYGALAMVECWGADVPDGEVTSYLKAVQCKPDATVCVGWAIWPSKSMRDETVPKVSRIRGCVPLPRRDCLTASE